MSNGPPWKLALVGTVAMIAGLALLFVDWNIDQLATFVAMLFLARGALHIVTTSFTGREGALSALIGCGEIAVGLATLAWPSPTLLVLVVIVGVWALVRGIVDATVVLATRAGHGRWIIRVMAAILEIALGVALVARPGGTIRDAAVTLGLLVVLEGALEISVAVGRGRHEPEVRGTGSVQSLASAS